MAELKALERPGRLIKRSENGHFEIHQAIGRKEVRGFFNVLDWMHS